MTPAARPYAEALFAALGGRGAAGGELSELEGVVTALAAAPRARDLLVHPGAAPQAAEAILNSLAAGRTPLVANLLRLLFHKGRFAILEDVVAGLRARLDAAAGRVEARVQAARPIPPAQAAALQAALSRRLGSTVELRFEEHPELIGGLRVAFGDRVLDGSLAGQLASLRRHLTGARA